MNYEILLALQKVAKPLYRYKSWHRVITYLDEFLFLYHTAWIQINESLEPEQYSTKHPSPPDYSSLWTHKVHIRRAA